MIVLKDVPFSDLQVLKLNFSKEFVVGKNVIATVESNEIYIYLL